MSEDTLIQRTKDHLGDLQSVMDELRAEVARLTAENEALRGLDEGAEWERAELWRAKANALAAERDEARAALRPLLEFAEMGAEAMDEIGACLSKCIAENGFEHYCHVDLAELLMDAAVDPEPRIVHYEEPIAAGEQVRLCRLEAGHEGDHDYAWVTEVELT